MIIKDNYIKINRKNKEKLFLRFIAYNITLIFNKIATNDCLMKYYKLFYSLSKFRFLK